MKIESNHQTINSSSTSVFEFLSDLNNYIELFPKDKIENWKSSEEFCSCSIKGMSEIGLKRVASTPNTLIYLDSHGKSPFKFTLNIYLSVINESQTKVYLIFEGDVNPFMKMMLEKPLSNFFNSFISSLTEKYN